MTKQNAKRTPDDILVQSPITVILGGEEVKIRLLNIRESREWRAELAKLLSKLPQWANVTTDTPDEFEAAMGAMLVEVPDSVADLFFLYAKDLDREAIENKATDAELAVAFEIVSTQALPLGACLGTAMARPTPKAPHQAPAPSNSS